ncbi:MAG: hypothetical protein H0U74_09150 [Bradymonadaceae bacterium]|nr:hypothetical protein [Lujinxingiaceae bacterium]
MGVIYLLLYLLGGLIVTVGSYHLLSDILDELTLWSAFQTIGFGAAIILGAGLLHALTIRRRGNAGVLEDVAEMSGKTMGMAAAAWLLPSVAAWVQFELFIEPVHMFPIITFFGGVALAFGVCSRLMTTWPMRRAAAAMGTALFGIPLGLLAVSLPLHHFNYHLTNVHVSTRDYSSRATKTQVFKADDPTFKSEMVSSLGKETSALLNAIANAKTIDVAQEVAAGRMRQLDDGSYVTVNADGSLNPVGGAGNLEHSMDEALAADRTVSAEAQAQKRREWEQEIWLRRNGGRLFSSPDRLDQADR